MRSILPTAIVFLTVHIAVCATGPQLDGEAASAFEKFASGVITEKRSDSVVTETRGKLPNTYVPLRFVVELKNPEYRIHETDIQKVMGNLTPAEKLNGKLKGVEWHGYAVTTATAYKVLETLQNDSSRIYKSKWGLMTDGKWHPFRANGLFDLCDTWVVVKRAGNWSVEPISDDNNYGDSHRSYTLDGRPVVASGYLSKDKPESTRADVAPDDKQIGQMFEALVQARTGETITLKRVAMEGKVEMKTLDEPMDEKVERIIEVSKPRLVITADKLTDAEKLNGIQGRATVKVDADAWRTVSITPAPPKYPIFDDGRWNDGSNIEFKAICQNGEWKLLTRFVPKEQH